MQVSQVKNSPWFYPVVGIIALFFIWMFVVQVFWMAVGAGLLWLVIKHWKTILNFFRGANS